MPELLTPLATPFKLAATFTAAVGESDPPGTFEAVITAYGVRDVYDRIIEPGALSASIERGFPAVVYAHQDTLVPIGVTAEIAEDGNLVRAKGTLFVGTDDDEGSELARDVYRAMTVPGGDGKPALRDVSIGAMTKRYEIERAENGDTLLHFTELDLIEWGPCLRGAHPDAHILEVKASLIAGAPPAPASPRQMTAAERAAVADVLLAG